MHAADAVLTTQIAKSTADVSKQGCKCKSKNTNTNIYRRLGHQEGHTKKFKIQC